jgi:hypothetical protein
MTLLIKIFGFIFEKLSKFGLTNILSDKQYIKLDYFIFKKEKLNLENPQTYSEKIQWIKIYGKLDKYSKFVDKYEVRKFVERTIGEKYLIPLLGVWDRFEDIPFEKLPNQFVLKSTNGSGTNFICEDKSKLDKAKLKKIANSWLNRNFYYEHREIQYKPIKPRLIAEKYMKDDVDYLMDYKFFCFNGVPKLIEVYLDVFTDEKVNMFDANWKKLDISLHFPNSKDNTQKPKQFNEMMGIARKLSKEFPFVRVDLYIFKDKVYFGELTFTPGNGMYNIRPSKADFEIGKLIDLSKFKYER